MRSQKGYSLLELLAVLLIMALLIVLITLTVLGEINKARGSALIAQARMVHVAAQAVIMEEKANLQDISDEDYMAGLTGTVNDASLPVQTHLSQRITTLLAPDVALSDEPDTGTPRVTFEVKGGVIIGMIYEITDGVRHYTITFTNGEVIVTHKHV